MNWKSLLWLCMATLVGSAAAQTTVTNSNDGANNMVPVYTGSSALGNSPISVSGGNVGIGTTSPGYPFVVSVNNPVAQIVWTRPETSTNSWGLNSDNHASYWENLTTGGIAAITVLNGGNVGVGTSAPGAPLEINGNNAGSLIRWQRIYNGTPTGKTWTLEADSTGTDIANATDSTVLFRIQNTGNVGIGTTNPAYVLDVVGNIHASAAIIYPDGSQQTTAWTGTVCGGDYAESVDVSGDRTHYAPGDVLVIDPDVSGHFLKSAEAYSTTVTGIYSTKPGTVGRRQSTPKNPDEVPMAMIGIVLTKVSVENGPIHRGDLLVTSSTPGYAMKGTDRSRMLGAVIGKALGTLDSGNGMIEVVVTLQ